MDTAQNGKEMTQNLTIQGMDGSIVIKTNVQEELRQQPNRVLTAKTRIKNIS